MNEIFFLDRCLQLIEEKVRRGDRADWTNRDFLSVSQQISQETGNSISPDTLKRLYGKGKVYKPQLETKNTLALFLGFTTWEAFKEFVNQNIILTSPVTAKPEPSFAALSPTVENPESVHFSPSAEDSPKVSPEPAHWQRPGGRRLLRWGVALLSVLFLLAVGGWYFKEKLTGKEAGTGQFIPEVRFEGKNLVNEAPLPVVFHYDVSQVASDKVKIDFGNQDIKPLPKDKHTITYSYQLPNFCRVRLLAEGKELSSLNVHALSNGWRAALYHNRTREIYPVLAKGYVRNQGRMYLSPESAGFGQGTEDVGVTFRNIRDYAASGDHMTYETRVRNNAGDGGLACYDAFLQLVGEKGVFQLMFAQTGCFGGIKLIFSEKNLDGNRTDLSAFTTDLSNWRVVRLQTAGQRVTVFLDDKLVYSVAYRQPIGALKGIITSFKGFGSVDYVRLRNHRQQLVYGDEFE